MSEPNMFSGWGKAGKGPVPPKGMDKIIIPIIIVAVVLTSIGSFWYQVETDEVGVVRRLGKYTTTTMPGLRFKLPWGIDTVTKVRVKHRFKEEFGFRTKQAGVRTEYFTGREYGLFGDVGELKSYNTRVGLADNDPFLAESFMLTGDLNAAEVEWVVQYEISDPVAYAFRIRDMQRTIRAMSESVMRQVVGDATVDEVITYGKDMIQTDCQEKLQRILDQLGCGIKITNVVLQDVNPPTQVKASFNEVNEARQEKERFINEAWQEYNRAVPRMEGEAQKMFQEAEGYALKRVNEARGDADRFIAMYEEYKNAQDVTKRQLYIQTMRDVLPTIQRKIIIDENQQGILPFLNVQQQEGK